MRAVPILLLIFCLMPPAAGAIQIVAGSQEDRVFQQISAETNADAKLQRLSEFETQFPKSKVLPSIYLMAIELYREKNDTDRIIEYGEKVIKLDEQNVTAMMVLSRSYAMQRKNLDRAVELAEKALDRIGKLKTSAAPSTQTDAQWKAYWDSTEAAARNILNYAQSIRGR
jgi:hypothetical protein